MAKMASQVPMLMCAFEYSKQFTQKARVANIFEMTIFLHSVNL